MSTAAPPPPSNNTLVLPLPPGMTGEQYLTLQGQLVTIGICVAASCAVVIWDYLITFKDELTLYTVTSAAAWKQPGTWAFVVLRYASIAALVSALFFTSAQSTNCGFTVRFSSFMVALVVAAAGVIFAYRVLALWKGNKTVYAVLGLFYLVNVGAWMATAASYAADTGPPTPFNSNCQLHPVASWNPISFGSSVVFDCVVLGLTVLKLRQNFGARSTVQKQLYKDNLLYFVIVTATNLTVLIINALPDAQFALVKPAVEPFSTVITTTMAQRVYLNLRLLHKRAEGAHSTASGGADSIPPSFHFTKHDHQLHAPAAPLPGAYKPSIFFTRETTVTDSV